jgi:AraC family transcriptional regulator of adaptative response/methylated-DNA-[protein]-cysteine methyltransferase
LKPTPVNSPACQPANQPANPHQRPTRQIISGSHPRFNNQNCKQEPDSRPTIHRATINLMNTAQKLAIPPAPAIDPETAWQQLLARDPAARFLYAVATTGVFCRPTCSSRRPLRPNVRFFPSAAAAQAAGFRPCKRCRPESTAATNPIATVRAHIEANSDRTLALQELGRVAGLSPFTVQRLFKKEFGVSPLQYQRALRARSLRGQLKRQIVLGGTVTTAIYQAGFGSSSRAYEGSQLGMTPGRFAAGGKGERIGFAVEPTSFGWLIVGATARGLCWLALGDTAHSAEASLRAEFPAADISPVAELKSMVEAATAFVAGSDPMDHNLPLDLRGTAFQLRVWQALRAIPRGQTVSYSQLASQMGIPSSTRAVARACATNRVALLVPCHRVVGAGGSLTGYRWGVEKKRQLLQAEARPARQG